MVLVIIALIIICFCIFIYALNNSPSDYFVRDYKTNSVYYYTDFDSIPKRVKIIDTYIDESGRNIIEFIYIDDDGNHISDRHNKSLYNFISMIKRK
jgi:hypothetical protein